MIVKLDFEELDAIELVFSLKLINVADLAKRDFDIWLHNNSINDLVYLGLSINLLHKLVSIKFYVIPKSIF